MIKQVHFARAVARALLFRGRRQRRSLRHSRECPGRRQGADHRGLARSADPLPRLGRARRPRARDARRYAGAPVSRGRAAVAGLSTRRREGWLGTDRRRGWHHRAAARRVVLHGQERQPRSQAVRRFHRRFRRAVAGRRHRKCRPRVRRVRHRSARVQVGRLQGRGRQGQGPGHAQQRSGLGSEVVCGQYAPVLRPLDVQVRKRRAPRRCRRHHRAHHAVGRLSVAGRAVFLGR